jgi:hypothetical protein
LLELEVRRPLVVSIIQRRGEMRLYNVVQNLKISNPGSKTGSSNSKVKVSFKFFTSQVKFKLKKKIRKFKVVKFSFKFFTFQVYE